MPSYFLKQPDGKLALFSSVVDNFTAYAMTEDEAIAYGVEQWGRHTAEEKVKNGVEDAPLFKAFNTTDGLGRWRESLESIAMQHGLDALRETLVEIGFPDAEIPQSAIDIARGIEEDRKRHQTHKSPGM